MSRENNVPSWPSPQIEGLSIDRRKEKKGKEKKRKEKRGKERKGKEKGQD
jgi:hypothetical protein